MTDKKTRISLQRKRGRPTTLSRDKVIGTALKLVEKRSDLDITMAEVAAELGIVTMGLYKHVENKDDLLAGMAARVFSELDLSVDENLDLDERFRQWTGRYRDFFVDRPYASRLIAWHDRMSVDFMNWSADLVALLREYGLRGKKLAHALAWLTRQLNAYIMLEQSTTIDPQQMAREFDLNRLSKDRQRLIKPLSRYIARLSKQDLYQIHIDATLMTLKQMARQQ